MSVVNQIWSITNGGSAISTVIDDGSAPNGLSSTPTELFIRHDGDSSITNVKIYMEQFTGDYTGSATPAADFSEMKSWGDGVTSLSFGGYQINMNAVNEYPTASWPTYSEKSPVGGGVVRNGVGDSAGNGITLSHLSGCTADGTIQAGSAPNVRIKTRITVPATEDRTGIRQFNVNISFSYTS